MNTTGTFVVRGNEKWKALLHEECEWMIMKGLIKRREDYGRPSSVVASPVREIKQFNYEAA